MPKVTAKHEQEVRDRIIRAAVDVFGSIGFRRATMHDVVKASGLSVGAIYTYFTGKDELFFACCDLIAGRDFGELQRRMPADSTPAQKLAVAISTFIDGIEATDGTQDGPSLEKYAVQAWAEVGQSAAIGETLARRRANLVGAALMLIGEAVAAGQLPAWVDQEGLAHGCIALLDGLVLDRAEQGAAWSRERAERYAFAILETLLASATGGERPDVERPPAAPFAIADAQQ
jgi:TetR/AcrR family transcriptional regulator, transcriptional repressor of aconitase